MGAVISRLALRKDDDNFEQILSELDAQIYRAEIAIAEANIKQRKVTALLTTYSLILYLFWLLSFFLMTWPSINIHNDGFMNAASKASPLVIVPFLIYSIRWIVQSYYKRYVQYQEQELEAYKKQQKQKVEEMKQKMKYYVAKNLIERYEGNSATPRKQLKPNQSHASGKPSAPTPQPSQPSQPMMPNTMVNPNSISSNPGRPMPLPPIQPQLPPHLQQSRMNLETYERTWVDRILDVIIGEESPTSKYALVCQKCFAHNGLADPVEFENIQYVCPKCGHFNSKRGTMPVGSITPGQSPQVSPSKSEFNGNASDADKNVDVPLTNISQSNSLDSREGEIVETENIEMNKSSSIINRPASALEINETKSQSRRRSRSKTNN